MDDAERGDVKTKFIGNLTDEVTREDVWDVLPSAQIAAVNRLRASTCESIGHDALHHHTSSGTRTASTLARSTCAWSAGLLRGPQSPIVEVKARVCTLDSL